VILLFPFILFGQKCEHSNLSDQFNISIQLKENSKKNPAFDSLYLKLIITLKDGTHTQTIRRNMAWLWDKEYFDCQNVRSYSKSINDENRVVDNDFGDFIVADLNFDQKDDFAFIHDSGGNGGPEYYFYIQKKDGTFERNIFLCEEMVRFPHEINYKKKELTTLTRAGASAVGKAIFSLNPLTNRWYLKSRELLTD